MSEPIRHPLCREAAELCENLIDLVLQTRTEQRPFHPKYGQSVGMCSIVKMQLEAIDPAACEAFYRFALLTLQGACVDSTVGLMPLGWDTARMIDALRTFRRVVAEIERSEQDADAPVTKLHIELPNYLKNAYREYSVAVKHCGKVSQKELYQWIEENRSDNSDDLDIATFFKYVRLAKKKLGLPRR